MGIGESKQLNNTSTLFTDLPYSNVLRKNKRNVNISLNIPVTEIIVNKLDKSTINEINKSSYLLASESHYVNFIFYEL